MSRTLLLPFVILFLVKVLLAIVFPVFGDEAYYLYWGSHFSGGFYDLPPMIGWWLWPLMKISLHPLWIRLFNLAVPALIAFGLYEWLSQVRVKQTAALTALLFFALPLPFLTVISFPDVPLLFFGFFSALLFFRGVSAQVRFLSFPVFISGSLFGAAFLSKYFAVFLLPAFAIWAWPRARFRMGVILSFFLGSLPFLFQHLSWNQGHCWSNAVFNLVTRQQAYEGTALSATGFFLAHLLVVSFTVLPFCRRRDPDARQNRGSLYSFLFLLWLIPVLIFLTTALLGRGQGLHWLLFLTPFFVGWVSFHLPAMQLRNSFLASSLVSGMLAGIFLIAFLMPERVLYPWVGKRYPFEFGLITTPLEFIEQVEPEVKDSNLILTESYSLASLLHYEFQRHSKEAVFPEVGVALSDSRFGRAFDFNLDWKSLQGKKVAVLKTGRVEEGKYQSYFSSVRVIQKRFKGAEYSVLIGEGFKAPLFWMEKVKPELERFYPPFLPGQCSLKEVYRAD